MAQDAQTVPQKALVGNQQFRPAFEQEVRFALVMYGGVSLAIYINGVTQEFLRLVKSTAVDAKGQLLWTKPGGTEDVYRRVSNLLQRSAAAEEADKSLRAQFIVDIASGSSAGGINAIFLGKALAGNRSLDQLRDLWIKEAGFEDLLNDTKGRDGSRFIQDPPKSLLGSDGIYNKLVDAFLGMESKTPPVPLQPEMDVFATATDLQGIELPIELADKQVFEKKHKQVFHLSFETDGNNSYLANDFTPEMNSFLAFVARATSSFPVAFEPMCLDDMDRVLQKNPNAAGLLRSNSEKLKRFFPDYVSSLQDGGYRKRAFGDGGDLNNKPFTHAIEALSRRTTTLPMVRKLVYIEPSPDKFEPNTVLPPPDFIANTLDATVILHQNETIREDLQRLLDRNRLIERTQEVIENVGEDVRRWKQARPDFQGRVEGAEYEKRTIVEEIRDRGPGYAGYYRLKVRAVTDDLAGIVTRAAELFEASDEYRAIRYIVGEWRHQTYGEDGTPGLKSASSFLLNFDLNYRQRRIRFLLTKLDERFAKANDDERQDIIELKRQLNEVARGLNNLERKGQQRGPENFAYQAVQTLGIDVEGRKWLRSLLGMSEARRNEEIRQPDLMARIKAVAAFVVEGEKDKDEAFQGYKSAMVAEAKKLTEALNQNNPNLKTQFARDLRLEMREYFDDFEYYDQVIFPIFYETSVGEAEPASVIRISPQDATSVIDETKPGEMRKKLAGTVLFHFGAFFDRLWRSNDVLWGRMDGAERIINCLIPEDPLRAKDLIWEAHLAIIREELRPAEQAELQSMMVRAILNLPREARGRQTLRQILERQVGAPIDTKVDAVFTACMDEVKVLNYLMTSYEVNREFNPARALNVISRSTQIIGSMFEDLSKSSPPEVRPALSKSSAWVARLGSFFWGLVELAVPGGLGNKLLRHWIKVLYAFELVMLVGSTILLSAATQRFAITALVLTAGVQLVTSLLSEFIRMKRGLFYAVALLSMLIVLGLAAFGAWTLERMF